MTIFPATTEYVQDRQLPVIESESVDILMKNYSENAHNEEQNSEYAEPDQNFIFSGSLYEVVNNNIPFFTKAEMVTDVFEEYSPMDQLGRCGVAYANICIDIMPTESREAIGNIRPSGWHTVKYNGLVEVSFDRI